MLIMAISLLQYRYIIWGYYSDTGCSVTIAVIDDAGDKDGDDNYIVFYC